MPKNPVYAPVVEPDHAKLIHFDIRAHDAEDIASWSAGRRFTYLINEEAPPPYSLDRNVWTSFLPDSIRKAFKQEWEGALELQIESSPGSLLTHPQKITLTSFCSVEETNLAYVLNLISDAFAKLRKESDLRFQVISFSVNIELMNSLFPKETFLGFDVVDDGWFSAIVNCGYGEEKSAVQERYSNKLTWHHLFDDESVANEFRVMSDSRIVEHAPFLVYQIHDISSIL